MSTLGKSDYRDNLLNSKKFPFVSIEFCRSESQIPLHSSTWARASQPDAQASVPIVSELGKINKNVRELSVYLLPTNLDLNRLPLLGRLMNSNSAKYPLLLTSKMEGI